MLQNLWIFVLPWFILCLAHEYCVIYCLIKKKVSNGFKKFFIIIIIFFF